MSTGAAAATLQPLRPGFARDAESLHLDGETGEALRLLTAGIRRHPRDVTARLVLADICLETGRVDEACDWLKSVLRADPECPAARSKLAAMLEVREAKDADLAPSTARPDPDLGEARRAEHPTPNTTSTHSSTQTTKPFVFPVREEEEEPEIEEISAPHVATVTLAEIYLQQGLKEQAAMIYRQLLERQPGDDSVRRRLQEIEEQ